MLYTTCIDDCYWFHFEKYHRLSILFLNLKIHILTCSDHAYDICGAPIIKTLIIMYNLHSSSSNQISAYLFKSAESLHLHALDYLNVLQISANEFRVARTKNISVRIV